MRRESKSSDFKGGRDGNSAAKGEDDVGDTGDIGESI